MKLYNVCIESVVDDAICREEALFVDLDDAIFFIEQEHEVDYADEIWIVTLDTDRKRSYGMVDVVESVRIY
jgi:hypothetical protein